MDKYSYLNLFLIGFSISEIANKLNVNSNLNDFGAYSNLDSPLLVSVVGVGFMLALYALMNLFFMAEKECNASIK